MSTAALPFTTLVSVVSFSTFTFLVTSGSLDFEADAGVFTGVATATTFFAGTGFVTFTGAATFFAGTGFVTFTGATTFFAGTGFVTFTGAATFFIAFTGAFFIILVF